MDELPVLYSIETVEQMRAMADGLRMRILDHLTQRALTVTQLGAALGLAASKVHYHVRELERVGLVRLVETREKGGILEKYYRAVARSFDIPRTLLRALSPDEGIAAVNEMLQTIGRQFMQAMSASLRLPGEQPDKAMLSAGLYWMTDQEYAEVRQKVKAILDEYDMRRDLPGERQHCFVQIAYPSLSTGDEGAPLAPSVEPWPGAFARQLVAGAGAIRYSRKDLERVVEQGGRLDVNFVGACRFAADVSPELVERAVARFHLRGALHASPAVREVLKRKEV